MKLNKPEEEQVDHICQSIMGLFLEDFVRTECIDFMWQARTESICMNEIYNLLPLEVLMDRMNENYEALSGTGNTKGLPKSGKGTGSSQASSSSLSSSTQSSKKATGGKGKAHNTSKASSNAIPNVTCAICKESVSGSRFAVHLEKCMNGGKRGSRRFYESLDYHSTSTHKPTTTTHKPKQLKPPIGDPNPGSLVVRIKLKNGVPRGNNKRIGVSLEEWQSRSTSASTSNG